MLVCQRRRRLEKVSNPEDTNSKLTRGRQVVSDMSQVETFVTPRVHTPSKGMKSKNI